MKYPLYNQAGERIGETDLSEAVFGLPMNKDLVYQAVIAYQANKRQNTADTKTRKDVSGGGRKPWRQKGTGRARHGSIRSPIWIGGGVAFGPSNQRVYKKKLLKKMKTKALLTVLSAKAREKGLFIVDDLKIAAPKTKLMAQMMVDLRKNIKPMEQGTVLIVLPQKEENLLRASRNLPQTKVACARNLNALRALSCSHLLMSQKALKVLEEVFVSEAKSKSKEKKEKQVQKTKPKSEKNQKKISKKKTLGKKKIASAKKTTAVKKARTASKKKKINKKTAKKAPSKK